MTQALGYTRWSHIDHSALMVAVDDDLPNLTREEMIAKVIRLRAGIRAHRDSSGHDLCWSEITTSCFSSSMTLEPASNFDSDVFDMTALG